MAYGDTSEESLKIKDANNFKSLLIKKIRTDCKVKSGEVCPNYLILQYLKQVVPDWQEMTSHRLYKHIQKMLENAEGIRRFEIDLIWRRAIYFIPLIIIFFTAFGGVFWAFNNELKTSSNIVIGYYIILILIAFINMCFCLLLSAINFESQQWQSNWEYHVDYLQEILGVILMRTCLRPQSGYLTIGRTNIFISVFMFTIWFIMLAVLMSLLPDVRFSMMKIGEIVKYFGSWSLIVIIFNLFCLIIGLSLFFYSLITGKNFFDSRAVLGGNNFYIRRLKIFAWDNKNKIISEAERLKSFSSKILLSIALSVGIIYTLFAIIRYDPEELFFILLIVMVFVMLLLLLRSSKLILSQMKFEKREKVLREVIPSATMVILIYTNLLILILIENFIYPFAEFEIFLNALLGARNIFLEVGIGFVIFYFLFSVLFLLPIFVFHANYIKKKRVSMKITISGYEFGGPYISTNSLENKSGVYIILGTNEGGKNWKIIDVGESGDVKKLVENYDRKDCWKLQKYAILNYAVHYTNESNREKIADKVRDDHNPPCGKI